MQHTQNKAHINIIREPTTTQREEGVRQERESDQRERERRGEK